MNEFFRCPSYMYGIIILTVLVSICLKIYFTFVSPLPEDASLMEVMEVINEVGFFVMGAYALALGWMVWCVWNWAFRHEDCVRQGFPEGRYMNPLAT